MATSCHTALKTPADLRGYVLYALDPRSKKINKEPVGERLLCAHGNFISCPKDKKDSRNIIALLAEIHLFSGEMWHANSARVALAPEDSNKFYLPDKSFDTGKLQTVGEELAKGIFPGRAHFIVWHGDSECGNLHCHIFSTFLDINRKALVYKGRLALKEGSRREDVVDEVCRRHGLLVIERPEGQVQRSKNKRTLKAIRAGDRGMSIWTEDMKDRITMAAVESGSVIEFVYTVCPRFGLNARLRSHGLSFAMTDSIGKLRKARASKLGSDFMLPAIVRRLNTSIERPLTMTTSIIGGYLIRAIKLNQFQDIPRFCAVMKNILRTTTEKACEEKNISVLEESHNKLTAVILRFDAIISKAKRLMRKGSIPKGFAIWQNVMGKFDFTLDNLYKEIDSVSEVAKKIKNRNCDFISATRLISEIDNQFKHGLNLNIEDFSLLSAYTGPSMRRNRRKKALSTSFVDSKVGVDRFGYTRKKLQEKRDPQTLIDRTTIDKETDRALKLSRKELFVFEDYLLADNYTSDEESLG